MRLGATVLNSTDKGHESNHVISLFKTLHCN